jgi:polyvinyl alcohol dehydrogenase (cytochrome)
MGRVVSLALAALCVVAGVARASDSPVAATGNGAALYAQRCATCHDHPQGRIPPRYVLGHKTADQVVQILAAGPMRQQAAGLGAEDLRALAVFLTYKRAGAWPEPDPRANLCAAPAEMASPDASQWNGWGRDVENSRYQPEPGLAAGDVPRLKLKWAFAYPGGETVGEPVTVGGRLYVTSATGRVFALSPKTGCTYWSFEAGAPVKNAISIGPLGAGEAAYFGDMAGFVHAVDAATGKEIWKVVADAHPLAQLRGSPKLYNGRLYVPVSSGEESAGEDPAYPCCTFRGSLVALDAATGRIIWKAYTIADEPRKLKKNPAGTQMYGPSGAAIWGSPTIDSKRNRIYVGTGNGYSGTDSTGADSVMAFDLDTGKRIWATQATPKDVYVVCQKVGTGNCPAEIGPDFDFGSSTLLQTLADGRQLLFAGQKSGMVYAFDPDHGGKIVWRVKLALGGAFGGIEHGITADSGHVYVPISDVGTSVAVPAGQDAPHKEGGIASLSLATGAQAWRTPAPEPGCSWGTESCASAQPAAPTAIPGIVFSGSLDGHIRAYAAGDGRIVWDFDTGRSFDAVNGAKAHGGAITGYGQTIAGGTLYVNSGGGYYGPAGNALLAFTVDGN